MTPSFLDNFWSFCFLLLLEGSGWAFALLGALTFFWILDGKNLGSFFLGVFLLVCLTKLLDWEAWHIWTGGIAMGLVIAFGWCVWTLLVLAVSFQLVLTFLVYGVVLLLLLLLFFGLYIFF